MSKTHPETAMPSSHGVTRGHVVAAIRVLRGQLAEPWTLDLLAEQV